MSTKRVIIIGAGAGGLSAAALLAARGLDVTVLERQTRPGGKIRQIEVAGRPIDSGPTVFTMRWVFEEIFAEAGEALADSLDLIPASLLARHAWDADRRLDLFADLEASCAAIGAFAGAGEARAYRKFCADGRRIYETLRDSFLRAQRPGPFDLVARAGLSGLPDLWRIQPFARLWPALGRYFNDPRLQQLFGRYATYSGSSPFAAPATLMLIAHVERDGVWLAEGGMYALARALAGLAARRGAAFRYSAPVARIGVERGRAGHVILESGERLDADAVIVNGDAQALAQGHFGADAARAVPRMPARARSLSALTFSLVGEAQGFALHHHTVFFSRDYRAEFDDLFRHGRLPGAPTVYICAQDRGAGGAAPQGPERLFCLINAPAMGERTPLTEEEIARCERETFTLLKRCGLTIRPASDPVITTPTDFEALFPATGGALYGRASHGWQASFRRPGARTRVPGLYLAGGSAHPGAGVPMAALSGRLAADRLMADLASTRK